MKLKYYLRTLGIGIMVTALLMGISIKKQNLSDEEIKKRAAELGMVDAGSYVLTDVASVENASEAESETVSESESASESVSESSLESESASESVSESSLESESASESVSESSLESESASESVSESSSESESASETVSETASESESVSESESESESIPESSSENESLVDGETVSFSVYSGDSSDRVSRRLLEVGLIDDAAAYDAFLCKNGYDKKISVGTYDIPIGSSWDEIAKIITRAK